MVAQPLQSTQIVDARAKRGPYKRRAFKNLLPVFTAARRPPPG
jgi:hypothetical protein